MDWLNWFIRIATILGGAVFLICFFFGALSIVNALRAELLLWEAKRKWLAFQRLEQEKKKPTNKKDDADDETEEDNP
jgi:hypothetical protein